MQETDFLIIGAGIMGLSIARELARRYSGTRILIVEKEDQAAFHASGRNSGVLHAGFYYDADSLKARFTVAGNRALTDYCLSNGLPINQCGKVVVACQPDELEGLDELKRRGDRNGVKLEVVDTAELQEIEPNARTYTRALFSPTTSTVNPKLVCQHIVEHYPSNVQVLFGCRMSGLRGDVAITNQGKVRFRHLFNAAGVYALKIANLFDTGHTIRFYPLKAFIWPAMTMR